MKQVRIIEYFAGNIFSVTKAFECFKCNVEVISHPEQVQRADYLVLPGVGAFGEGMKNLQKQNLVDAIFEFIGRGKPFLGICLGMQLLLTSSEEFGNYQGLNVIPGGVRKLPQQPYMKIPHIGWSTLTLPEGRHPSSWNDSILKSFPPNKDMYFAHSFACYPQDHTSWLSRTAYGKHWFCSSVAKDNVFGCQFHPEKSGPAGLSIIEAFLHL